MGINNNLSIRDYSSLSWLLRVLDGAALLFSGLAAYSFYVAEFPLPDHYRLALLIGLLLCATIFPMFGMYSSWRGKSLYSQFHRILLACSTVFVVMIVTSAVMKNTVNFSRAWFVLWFTMSLLSLMLHRKIIFSLLRYFRKRGWNQKNVLVVGGSRLNQEVGDRIKEADWTGFHITRFVEYNHNGEELLHYIKEQNIDEIWITFSLQETQSINDLLFLTRHMPNLKFRYIPDITDFQLLLNNSVSEVAGIVTIELNHSPLEGINILIKEIEDRVLAFFILLFISPILLLIAIAIKIESRGPVLFKQARHGWGGIPVNVYKFRSMFYHKESEGKFAQATKNDPRVTKVGAFIRKTSLDELPQFYNVLQGRMSIVGPRPHPIALNKQYMDLVENYFTRNKVKPGITGWAQINGWRGETDTIDKMKSRVEHDLYYIQNWSLWLDIKIIFLTIFRGFIGRNAY